MSRRKGIIFPGPIDEAFRLKCMEDPDHFAQAILVHENGISRAEQEIAHQRSWIAKLEEDIAQMGQETVLFVQARVAQLKLEQYRRMKSFEQEQAAQERENVVFVEALLEQSSKERSKQDEDSKYL